MTKLRSWVRLLLFLVPVLVSVACRIDLRRDFVVWRNWNHTLPFDKRGFTEVVSEVDSGVLQPDKTGQILLPQPLRNLTGDGCVYVTRDTDNRTLIFFPCEPCTWSFPSAHFFNGYLHFDGPEKALQDDAVNINCPPDTPSSAFTLKPFSHPGWFTASIADD